MTNDYLMKKVFRSNLAISIMALLAATIGMLVDGIVIGRFLGTECVSAFGLASPIFIVIAAVAGIFSNGGAACCSNHMGRGEGGKVRLNFTVTMLGALLLGLLTTVICIAAKAPLAVALGANTEQLTGYTAAYILGIGIGSVPIMLSQVIMYYIRLDNDSGLSFVSVIFMTACNIALDIVFGIVLKWGMFGMGLATSISYAVCLLVCCTHFLRKNNIFKFCGLKGGIVELKDVCVTGIPSALNRACMTIRAIFLNHLLMALAGAVAVSALTVQNNINQILSAITMGVGMTTMLMAGIFYGEKDDASMVKTLKISLKSGILLSVIAIIPVMIFAKPFVGLFLSADPEGMALAVRSLRMFCLSMPFSLSCVVLLNFYQCTKKIFMANLICLCHGLIFVVAVSFGLSSFMGTDGVWISFLIAEVLTLLVAVATVRAKSGKTPVSFAQMMLLSPDFVPDDEHVLDVSIKNDISQVMELSGRISEFCGKFSDDRQKIERLSLCIEEMAGNIVRHGFKDDKEHFIDIRIIMVEGQITFRMRDDGARFNPLQYANQAEDGDKATMGIRVIQKIAADMEYSNAIGLNNLTITL